MDAIRLKHLKTNRGVAAARKTADGFDAYQNSDGPPIVPNSIHDQHTETISLSEPLLDEWNHRLKNNLQILAGLLQSGYHKARNNSEAREVLSDAIRRVGAIGIAQGAYYCVRGSTKVNGQDLVNAVCANARILFGSDVSIDCETTCGDLPKEAAMPLALIINELLMNAAKYSGNQHGRVSITVGLSRRPGLYELCVQDEGRGFDLENRSTRSLGLRLVRALAQRLGGSFSVERTPGARCTVRFPASDMRLGGGGVSPSVEARNFTDRGGLLPCPTWSHSLATVLMLGVLWSGLAACMLGALSYDIAYWFGVRETHGQIR